MSGVKQPWAGIVATALVVAGALGFVSLFSFPVFTGWVSYFLLCVIPMQIVMAVTWGSNPSFAANQTQPVKGLLLTLTALVVGGVVAAVCHATIGGGINPPTPMLTMCSIVSVVVTFWAAIMWGGWPFTAIIKNPIAAGLTMLVACYVVNYALFRVFFDYGFMQGAPVYVAAQDPHGWFPAWNALVFYLSCLSAMFLIVNFDLWPLTTFPGVMRQPRLGAVWTLIVLVLGGSAFFVGVSVMGMDPVAFMVRVPGAVHFRDDRRSEHAQGIAVCDADTAGEGRPECCRGHRHWTGACPDVRVVGPDGDGTRQSGPAGV